MWVCQSITSLRRRDHRKVFLRWTIITCLWSSLNYSWYLHHRICQLYIQAAHFLIHHILKLHSLTKVKRFCGFWGLVKAARTRVTQIKLLQEVQSSDVTVKVKTHQKLSMPLKVLTRNISLLNRIIFSSRQIFKFYWCIHIRPLSW